MIDQPNILWLNSVKNMKLEAAHSTRDLNIQLHSGFDLYNADKDELE